MAIRKNISKRVRFEVLKRDAFTCQYCGKSAPDVILHIDHIKPVSKGGNNGILNLVTSCQSCNSGKSDIELSDDSAVKRQQKQIMDMAEKHEQIKLMIEWKESIQNSEDLLVDSVADLIGRFLINKVPNDHGKMLIRKAIKKSSYHAVFDCVNTIYSQSESVDDFSKKWAKGISYAGKKQDEFSKKINYAKGILRNRFNYLNQSRFYAEVKSIGVNDDHADDIIEIAKLCRSVSHFFERLEELANG